MTRAALLLIASVSIAAVLATAPPDEPPPIELTVNPRAALAPADVHLHVRIPPATENRAVRVEAICEGEAVRASEWTLEGADARVSEDLWWYLDACEELTLRAILFGENGPRGMASQRATLRSRRGGDDDPSAWPDTSPRSRSIAERGGR